MRTRHPGYLLGAAVALGFMLAVGAFAVSMADPAVGPMDNSGPTLAPDDLARLADLSLGEPPEVGISKEAAISAASREYDFAAAGASEVEAYGGTVTVPGSSEVKSRGVWIVSVTGLQMDAPAPMNEDGTPAQAPLLTRGYIFVDARTGDVLFAEWMP